MSVFLLSSPLYFSCLFLDGNGAHVVNDTNILEIYITAAHLIEQTRLIATRRRIITVAVWLRRIKWTRQIMGIVVVVVVEKRTRI